MSVTRKSVSDLKYFLVFRPPIRQFFALAPARRIEYQSLVVSLSLQAFFPFRLRRLGHTG